MIKHFAAASLMVLASGSPILAQTVYPIDRAEILSGAKFDFKVEFPDRVDPAKLKVTVNGEDHAAVFGRAATFIEREDGKDQSALMLRDVVLTKPGPRHGRSRRWHAQPQADVDGLRHRAAQGEERDPVHRRRAVAGPSHRRAAACPRALRKARASASSPSTTCPTWRWWRPPARIRSSPIPPTRPAPMPPATRPPSTRWASMPTAPPVRSTTPGSKPSPASPSAGSTWASVSSPIPKSRMRRRPRWSRIPAAAPPMTRSSSSFSPPGPTC